MPIKDNFQDVLAVYVGDKKVWERTEDVWIEIPLLNNIKGKIEYLESDGVIYLRGKVTNWQPALVTGNVQTLTIPDKYKSWTSYTNGARLYDDFGQTFPVGVFTTSNHGRTLTLTITSDHNTGYIDLTGVTFTFTK